MTSEQDNNKRIAKNTIFLYLRMFVSMLVGLYTSRIVLNSLGVSDYGVYNVMGGIIGMLNYVNQLLSGGTSRFITIELGRQDVAGLKQTFSISNSLALTSCVVIIILGETIGLWFMNTQLNIDPSRMFAANWVYQCALWSCCLTVIQSTFIASIIAHEKMDIFAYTSLFDVFVRLFIAISLMYSSSDRLILFALLMFIAAVISTIFYIVIGLRKFEECNLRLSFNKVRLKQMMNYSGWNMIGGFANVLNNYGLNILLNVFFGTLVNAARGIAMQVSTIVQQFYSSFQTASHPQIIKYFAQNDLKGMSRLICNTSKYGAYLLICLIIPIAFNIDDFLMIWLGHNPEYTSWFTRLILFQILFQAIDVPVGNGIQAVGKMKLPNLTSAFFYLSVFPLSYFAFKNGADPLMGYCIYLTFAPIILFVDLLILKKYTNFSIRFFLKCVVSPVFFVVLVILGVLLGTTNIIVGQGVDAFILRCLWCFFVTIILVFFLGIPKSLRFKLLKKIAYKFSFN